MSERYQERVYKSKIEQAYDDAYWKIRQLKCSIDDYNNLAFELRTMLFVVADCIAYNCDCRDIIEKDLYPSFEFELGWEAEKESYHYAKSRIEFYTKIADNSINLRGDCLLIDIPSSIKNNPCTRCAVAFCDILNNPTLLSNYANGPVMLHGFDKNFDFATEIVMPMIDIILEYMANVMKLCGITETTPSKKIKPITSTVDDGDDSSLRIVFAILGGVAIVVSALLYLIWGI